MATGVNMLTMPICFFILGVYLSFSMGLKITRVSYINFKYGKYSSDLKLLLQMTYPFTSTTSPGFKLAKCWLIFPPGYT